MSRNKYSKNLKQNLRTAYNRAKKSELKIQTFVEYINDNTFNDITKISDFKISDGKNSMYKDNYKLLFMKKITKIMNSNIIFVKINGINVAYRINVLLNENKFCIDASYDRNFRKFELGSLSVDANLRDSYENNILTHCFGPGLDFYKKKFTKNILNVNIFISPGNSVVAYPIYYLVKFLVFKKSKQFKKELEK